MSALKRIGIIIGHPTQFEGPLFQYIAKQQSVDLEVIYYNNERMNNVYDPELQMELNWGIDLLSGYKYFVVPNRNKFLWLKDKFKKGEYDLLIINGYNRLILIYAVILGKLYSKKIALRLDTVEFSNNNSLKKILKKKVFWFFNKLFNHFFAIGTLTIEYLKRVGINQNKISIFSYVIDNDFFKIGSKLTLDQKVALKEQLKIPATSKVIISVAKFSEREAPWDLLKAMVLIKELNLHLLLVGDGPLKNELEEYVNNNFNGRVTFAGYVKYTDLPKYYGISDLFVHTSINEPWGVSVQEAIASGLPIITSDKVGSSIDLIIKNENGFVYHTGNIEDLKNKILNALQELSKDIILTTNCYLLSNWNYKVTFKSILKAI